jgi:metallo-beta-lactamase family protein
MLIRKNFLYLILLWLIVGFLLACQSQRQNLSKTDLSVTVYGAAGTVSGSLSLIDYDDHQYLVDCGAYYPDYTPGLSYEERTLEATEKNDELPVDAEDIEALFVTHAHLDHIGRIPLLVRSGFQGKIYCTPGSRQIMEKMLFSQIFYSDRKRHWVYSKNSIKTGKSGQYVTGHWNHCKWQGKISERNKRTFYGRKSEFEKENNIRLNSCRTCTHKELDKIMAMVVEITQEEPYKVAEGFVAEFLPTEHIPGATSVFLRAIWKADTTKLLFSGDVGNTMAILQKIPAPFPEADYVWIESTYGDTERNLDIGKEVLQFQQDVAKALNNGRLVWIPAFALDRTQKVLYLIEDAMEKGIISRNIPVYCPSPLAKHITGIYQAEFDSEKHHWFNQDVRDNTAFFPDYKKYLPDKLKYPSIVITTSGMMDNAFSLSLLPKLLNDPRANIFLVGYQDPDSPGGQLKAGKETVTWKGEIYSVAASVHSFSFFSAHADAIDVLMLLKQQSSDSTRIFLVHGDKEALEKRENYLHDKGFRNVATAVKGKKTTIW